MIVAGAIVKVTLNDETRRFDLVGASFTEFKKMIVERFLTLSDDFSVQYRDEDGDLVTVSSDAELREAIDGMKTTVKFIVSDSVKPVMCGPPSNPPESQTQKFDKIDSESDGGRHGRKVSKKLLKKEEKEAKKESLKREVLDELRKEFGSNSGQNSSRTAANSSSASPLGPAAHTGVPPSAQIPSGEKLQGLLQAVVESLGMPAASVYEYLNALTPEVVRSSVHQHSPSMMLLRMLLGRFGAQSGQSNPSFTPPSFTSPPFPPPPPPPPPPHGGPGQGGPGYWHGPPPPWGSAHWPHDRHHQNFHHGPPPYGPPFNVHPGPFSGMPVPAAGTESTPPQPASSSTPQSVFGGWFGGQGFGNFPIVDFSSVDKIPTPPPAPLSLGSCGDEVSALQSALMALGYLHCGPWHLMRKHFGKKTMEAVYR